MLQQFFVAAALPNYYLAMTGQYSEGQADMTQTTQKMTHPAIIPFLHVFVEAGMCSLSCCEAMVGGLHIHTHRFMGGIYKAC
jgi:hypothetical protein